jgi:hypothetical protein
LTKLVVVADGTPERMMKRITTAVSGGVFRVSKIHKFLQSDETWVPSK